MKTDIRVFASFMAAAIWADEEYLEAEKEAVKEVAEALEFKEDVFVKLVDEELAKVKKLSAEKATEYLEEAAAKVDDEEVGIVMEAFLQIVISDNVLSYDEMTNLLAAADALDMDHQFVMLMLADLIKSEPELEISFD
ncbi:MAG: hypothetical protein IK041_06060 [Bacteroidales bacterium]|nr:hypothetical protein [Bacteroidales bacterium]